MKGLLLWQTVEIALKQHIVFKVVGRYWNELYYALPIINGSTPYIPDVNYFERYDKIGGNYRVSTKGEVPKYECIRLKKVFKSHLKVCDFFYI